MTARLASLRDRIPLDEFVRLAVVSTGYDAVLQTLHMGENRLANVEKLAEAARGFGANGLFTFSDFVEYITAEEVLKTHDIKIVGKDDAKQRT